MNNVMQVQFKFKCLCLEEIPVQGRKPSLVRPTIVVKECPCCESKMVLRVLLSPKKGAHEVVVKQLKFEPSGELAQTLAEEEQWKKQQLEARSAVSEACVPGGINE